MGTLIINGYVYRNEKKEFLPLDLLCEDGRIVTIGERGSIKVGENEVFDASGMALLPGMVDVHTHGRDGCDFNTASLEDMKKMAVGYALGGVTTVMPTLASAPLEEMMRAVALINSFESDECAASFCGVHLEGRYLNAAKRGAPAANMLSALEASELDAPELRDCAALHISAAYELDDGSFAKKAIEIGATLALAHTAATYAEAKEAERRGVSAYSHLFNAMPPIHHRDGGAVVACLREMPTESLSATEYT